MERNRAVDIILLVILAAALLTGTWYLMSMRFKAGDVYPPYSSLRADPLGGRALYDALEHLDSVTVRRHYMSMDRLYAGEDDTILILGARYWQLYRLGAELDRMAADGARVVVALKEHVRRGQEAAEEGQADTDGEETGGEPEKRDAALEGETKNRGNWSRNLEIEVSGAIADSSGRYYPELTAAALELPEKITVTSPVFFSAVKGRWSTIYSLEEGPVVMERSIGKGTVVLLTDSYPFSNEALRWELYPRLLSWLVSGSRNVVFMEHHLGVRETRGVMTLVRQYRLITMLLCFAVVALLAVWKNAVPLVKIQAGTVREGEHIVTEKDQFTGFVSLLKRNIGIRSIVQVCLREIRKGSVTGLKRGLSEGSFTEISRLATGEKDPVKAYNRITRKLSERTRG